MCHRAAAEAQRRLLRVRDPRPATRERPTTRFSHARAQSKIDRGLGDLVDETGARRLRLVTEGCCRLGLAVLQRPLPQRDDGIVVIDHTVALGALKCLVVLGIPASRLAETGDAPRPGEMTVVTVAVTANRTGVWVAAVLEQVNGLSNPCVP